MTVTVTFDSVNLPDPAPLKPRVIAGDVFEITIECHTDDYDDITAIKAKQGAMNKKRLLSGKTSIQTLGTKGSLVIAGTGTALDGTYTNCAIDGEIQITEMDGTGAGHWKYSVPFVQDTSS